MTKTLTFEVDVELKHVTTDNNRVVRGTPFNISSIDGLSEYFTMARNTTGELIRIPHEEMDRLFLLYIACDLDLEISPAPFVPIGEETLFDWQGGSPGQEIDIYDFPYVVSTTGPNKTYFVQQIRGIYIDTDRHPTDILITNTPSTTAASAQIIHAAGETEDEYLQWTTPE